MTKEQAKIGTIVWLPTNELARIIEEHDDDSTVCLESGREEVWAIKELRPVIV